MNGKSSYNVSVFLGVKLHGNIELGVVSILPELNRLLTEKCNVNRWPTDIRRAKSENQAVTSSM